MQIRRMTFYGLSGLICTLATLLFVAAMWVSLEGDWTSECLGVTVSAAAVLVACGSLLGTFYQYRQSKAMDLLHAINLDSANGRNIAKTLALGKELTSKFSLDSEADEIIGFLEKDEVRWAAVLCTLGEFDDLAISIRAWITDEGLLYDSFHGGVLRIFDDYYCYISALRETKGDPRMYIGLQWLYVRWRSRRPSEGVWRVKDLAPLREHLHRQGWS